MKLFSRKAVAAVATTLALTAGALTVPAMADDATPTTTAAAPAEETTSAEPSTTTVTATATATVTPTADGSSQNGEGSSPRDIRDWIAVFTAIIGALTSVFAFTQRYL